MPIKLYIPIALIAGYLIVNFRSVDAFGIAIFLFISVGFYFRVAAARCLALFLVNYIVLLGLIVLRMFGSEFVVSVGGYSPNPIVSLSVLSIILILVVYSISGREIEAYFSKKIIPEKWLSYVNIHVAILYLAVGLASVTYHQAIETAHEAKHSSKSQMGSKT